MHTLFGITLVLYLQGDNLRGSGCVLISVPTWCITANTAGMFFRMNHSMQFVLSLCLLHSVGEAT